MDKIAVYGWREGEKKVKGRQSFDYTTKAYELNYCPQCGRKLGEWYGRNKTRYRWNNNKNG